METAATRYSGFVWPVAVSAAFLILLAAVFGPRPAFALLCHQIPARSLTVDGHLFAVCDRCTGIYAGLFLGLIGGITPAVRRLISTWGLRLLALAAALVILDVGFDAVHVLINTPVSRVVTGLGLGLAGGLFLALIALPPPNTLPVNP